MVRKRRKTINRGELQNKVLAKQGHDPIPREFVKNLADELEVAGWYSAFDRFWGKEMLRLPTGSNQDNLDALRNLCQRTWIESRLQILEAE